MQGTLGAMEGDDLTDTGVLKGLSGVSLQNVAHLMHSYLW